ncbi:MAG: IPExxxVDY family protein [Cytophagaceae bacterium]|jgi:hypothetical protein|nr:IPExxxVDY family protein [Cytophagaceae bacterium]
MKTTKLVIEYDFDFTLVGIIAPIKAYKFAWMLNKVLKTTLSKADDLVIDFLKEGKIINTLYIYETEYSVFRLIKNKSCEYANVEKPFLVPELKDYDYFVHITDESGIFDGSEIINRIKNLPGVQFVNSIQTELLKSRDNLIF